MRGAELGAFLRSRRLRAAAPTGPPVTRRTSGLRREELAARAGITHSWLVKLEQGRATSVSTAVLAALARSLDLDDAERTHLFALAGYRLGRSRAEGQVTPALRRLLDELEPNPAYVLDRCWNIVAWNEAEESLFPPLAGLAPQVPNLLELVFLHGELERLMLDIDEERARLVAQFRAHSIDEVDDPDVAVLVDRLCNESPAFSELWHTRDVRPFVSTVRRFREPDGSERLLDHHRLAVLDQPSLQLVVYTPTDQPASARQR